MQKHVSFWKMLYRSENYFEGVDTKQGRLDLVSRLCVHLAQVFILKSIKNSVNKKLANCWEQQALLIPLCHCRRTQGQQWKNRKQFTENLFSILCTLWTSRDHRA